MESIVIRPAQTADAPGIARVHVEAWRSTYRGIVSDAFLDNARQYGKCRDAH